MRKNLLFALAAIMSLTLLASCSDDDNNTPPSVPENEQIRLLVVNEGSYAANTSGISSIMMDGSVKNDIYKDINGTYIGSYGQSIQLIGNHFYVCVSGSKKILVLNSDDFTIAKEITHTDADFFPYQICIYRNGPIEGDGSDVWLAVVTNNNNSKAWVLDLDEKKIDHSFDAKTPTQDIVLIGDHLFAIGVDYEVIGNGPDGPTYIGVNRLMAYPTNGLANGEAIDDVEPIDRSRIIVDTENKLWVLTEDGVKRIDIDSKTVDRVVPLQQIINEGQADEKSYHYSVDYTGKLAISADERYIYFNATDEADGRKYVLSFFYGETDLFQAKKICDYTSEATSFYNMAYTQDTNSILIADAGNYMGSGRVLEYTILGDYEYEDASGNTVLKQPTRYNVGTVPYFFYFISRN